MTEMKKHIYDENNGLWYELIGDYYIPVLTLSSEEQRPIGKWGRMHRDYLKEHRPMEVSDDEVLDYCRYIKCKKRDVIVESISKAIHAGKKISFQYFEYDVNKNRVLRHDGKPYIISPYTMIWNGDYYYVVGFYDGRQEVNAFRVDRINACPEILPDDIVPIPEDFDPSKYSREVFRMYGTDEIVEVSLLCNSNLMMHVIDQFGIDVDTKPVDDEHFRAKVQIYPSPTFYRWVFGWGGKIKIESPSKIRKEYQTMLRDAIEMV